MYIYIYIYIFGDFIHTHTHTHTHTRTRTLYIYIYIYICVCVCVCVCVQHSRNHSKEIKEIPNRGIICKNVIWFHCASHSKTSQVLIFLKYFAYIPDLHNKTHIKT